MKYYRWEPYWKLWTEFENLDGDCPAKLTSERKVMTNDYGMNFE
jgi:hypothetical protein